jgi:hypothetical protein
MVDVVDVNVDVDIVVVEVEDGVVVEVDAVGEIVLV